MVMIRAVLITLLLAVALVTPGAAYRNTFEKRESVETDAVDARNQVGDGESYEFLRFCTAASELYILFTVFPAVL